MYKHGSFIYFHLVRIDLSFVTFGKLKYCTTLADLNDGAS